MKLIRAYLFGLLMLLSVAQAMAAGALVQFKTGNSALATTTVAFDVAPTNTNTIVLVIGSDDYLTSTPSTFTLSTGMSQQGYHGSYMVWRLASGGANSFSYTIGSAANSAWLLMEFSGLDTSAPYDTSAGSFVNSGTSTYTTPSITPTTGARFIVSSSGGSLTGTWTAPAVNSWTNSFTTAALSRSGGAGTNDLVAAGYRSFTGNGVTTLNTTADIYDGGGGAAFQSRSGLILAFKEAGGGGSPATLSAPTPSGTIGTSTTAVTGVTTDQNTGTLSCVLSTANNVSTATAAQVIAGQNSGGTAASFASTGAVSTTSPSCSFSGLTASTLYYYAEAQNNANGNSNVVSGSFTTAAGGGGANPAFRAGLLGVGR